MSRCDIIHDCDKCMYCQRLLGMRNKKVWPLFLQWVRHGYRHVEMYFAVVCLHPENSDLSKTIGGFLDI